MLSDDSSSESETGRFKSGRKERSDARPTTSKDERKKFPERTGQGRNRFEKERDTNFRRDIRHERSNFDNRTRDRFQPSRRSRDRFDLSRRSKDRHDPARKSREKTYKDQSDSRKHSPINFNRKHSRDRSPKKRKSPDISKQISEKRDFKSKVVVESAKDREQHKDLREDIKKNVPSTAVRPTVVKPVKRHSESPDKPSIPTKYSRSLTKSPVEESELELSDMEQQPASYYNMIPVEVQKKDKLEAKVDSEVHSITDSSDEEQLRAKLLNLEKKLDKTKKEKKKHKRHKKKSSKSKTKDKEEPSTSVEVSSTTDIIPEGRSKSVEPAEVTSTQKASQESSEEGELSTDDDAVATPIDPSDLRHRLKRTAGTSNENSRSPDLRDRLSSKIEISGPALPPHMQRKTRESQSPDAEGPLLPPQVFRKKNIGPAIPSDMREVLAQAPTSQPIDFESSDEEIGIGPLPTGSEEKWTDAHKKLEARALRMKIKTLGGRDMDSSDIKSREEWMLELPEAKAKHIGLGPRQFRAKEGPDMSDRSSWTDTPEIRARKAAGEMPVQDASETLLSNTLHQHIEERDNEQEQVIKKHKKKHKRDESLLEMHQRKLKKKKKKDEKEGPKERRPFDRDVDLQANRFDEAQKKSIIKKAQHLDTRFSRGEAKYL